MAVVARPSLTISTASNLPSTQITAGAQNFVFANVNLDASQSSEGIRVATLPAYVLTQGTNNADASDLSNCELWNGSTAVATGSNWTDTSNGAYAEFEFQNAFTVPKGTIVQLSLECNLTSNPSGTSYQVGLNGNGPALWIQAEGVASGDNVLPNSGLTVVNSSLPTITVSQ
jgi:hypothetical protein